MDNYFEQSVSGNRGMKEQLLYAACWAGVIVLALVALVSATSIVAIGEDSMHVNWPAIVAVVVCAAAAIALYRVKDRVYQEFDYILWNSEFEVSAVYNRIRRKKVGTIQLGKVSAWGPAEAMAAQMHGAKKNVWCVRPGEAWCVVYMSDSGKEAALLELSDEMRAQFRSVSSALRLAEVKP